MPDEPWASLVRHKDRQLREVNRSDREVLKFGHWPEWPALLPAGERHSHRCDERCVCPEDSKPMLYWPAGGEHACQDPNCRYAHGGAVD